jgi:hypothetical protein
MKRLINYILNSNTTTITHSLCIKKLGWYVPTAAGILLILISCNQTQTDSRESDQIRERNKIDRVQKEITALTAKNKNSKELKIDTCTSPAGLVIIVWGASDIDGEYYFFSDQKLVNRYHNELALVGVWTISGNKINITYTKKYFRKGIGDPIPLDGAVPGNYTDQYESYEYLSEDDRQTESYDWDDIKTGIKNNSGLYELAACGLDEKTFYNITDLQKESR